jgi:hypothetical protein
VVAANERLADGIQTLWMKAMSESADARKA